ncbi:MAG: phytanoyl-CoA dioxygenase family protein [Pseudomonadota bacterium]|jgi:hypothetical protein|nr:phytanoyl-CoA dioxygenase [Rhodospirillaceae bacterium]MBO91858.1 phytanoyl-CoA dioxygenase [Rhodospirillaceae bacterium]MEC7971326.1 phytanoyl-CoA dioxygenase family protein [Pseudomonadota bacterium]MEC9101808.1 phytanoyl-CoA dioxygenase family protein [Pseudomonadota bacterium]MED5227476.1 phytanoyl-CoA dioxygenase family protein [Pseudomonadota bacterium]|tara:strand:- start:132 stop:935 length:804 start_codon:yes stop_codon:yes gene_type:complete
MLTDKELKIYQRDGLVVPHYRLDHKTVQTLRQALDILLKNNPDADQNIMICPHLKSYGPQAIQGDAIWLDIAKRSDILDLISQVAGNDIILWGTTLFGKPANSGQIIPWHQDALHWPIEPKATTTVWIAIDECTKENGCLRFIPGSHRSQMPHIETSNLDEGKNAAVKLVLDQATVSENCARDILLEPGQMAIFDTWLVHGSKPNHSKNRRAAFVLRYMPASSYFDHINGDEVIKKTGAVTDYSNRPLYLLRGKNSGGNNLDIGHKK